MARISAVIVVAAWLQLPVAWSAEQTYDLEVPASSADRSLKVLARQTGHSVIFQSDDVATVQTSAVNGSHTLADALDSMLAGTELSYGLTGGELISITRNNIGESSEGVSSVRDKQTKRESIFKYLATVVAAAFVANQPMAAEDAPDGSAGELRVDEEIVVTASKRNQFLHEVPFSMQAFGGEELADANIRDLSELITFVPGASEGFSRTVGKREFNLRGTGGSEGSSATSYYVDESAFTVGSFAPLGRSFDMDRVEILRGPQGTLYGNGAMGGTIRYITRKPDTNQFETHVRTGYSEVDGGDAGWYIDAAVNVPLADTLAMRFVGSKQVVGGYAEDASGVKDVAEANISDARVSLLWTPTDTFSVSLFHSANTADQDGGTTLGSLSPPISISADGDFEDSEYDISSLTLNYDFSFASLVSATTFLKLENNAKTSLAFPLAPNGILSFQFGGEQEGWNHETRLSSSGDGNLQWVVGVFLAENETTTFLSSNLPAFFPASTVENESNDTQSYFGELHWELMDGQLIPLIGLRYYKESLAGDAPDGGDDEFSSTNPRFNLSWLPDEDSTFYLNIAKGFRSGSFNSTLFCDFHIAVGGLPCETRLDSDELWSYEVGMKMVFSDVTVEAAAYYQDWEDVRQSVPVSGFFATYQFADAEIFGIDASMVVRPESIEGLTLRANANWTRSEFKNVDSSLGALVGVENGDERPFTPDWTVSGSATYDWALTGSLRGFAYLGFSHIEPQLGAFGTTAEGGSRDLLRARLGVHTNAFGVYLFGSNLLNEDGAIFSQNPVGGATVFTQDYPQVIGLEFTFDLN